MDNLDLLSSEHQILRKTLQKFVKAEVEKQAIEHDQKELFNLKLFKKAGNLGILGINIKEESLGGLGLDAIASCIAHEELSTSDPGFCLAYLAHSVLCAHNLSENGNEEQKKMWLPSLCSGEWLGAMAMSEADAGTDILSMQTTAKYNKGSYVLNGRKMWITNGIKNKEGDLVDACLVYAKLENSSDFCLFMVEKGFKGFKAGQVIKNKTGMRASYTAELVFDNCQIPESHIVGKPGEALTSMMKNLEIERITLAAMSIGIARRALSEMNKYATQRIAFGKPIRQFGQIQKYLAQSYAELQSCRTYMYDVARRLNSGKISKRIETDSVKLIASQIGKKISDRAIQVMGGYGYVGEYIVERLWRDSKLLEIGGGTIEALEKNISKELSEYEI